MGDVADDEWLHRSINKTQCRDIASVKLSSTAFNDRYKKPSVDRAHMRSAEQTKFSPTDGVVKLLTVNVRKVAIEQPDDNGNYDVDVWSRPVGGNDAHAQIEPKPEMTTSRFDKLKEALARLAAEHGWVIPPT